MRTEQEIRKELAFQMEYRKKHLELYGRASNGFEQRLKFAIESLNLS